MKRFIEITRELIEQAISSTLNFITNNLRKFAKILELILPFLMYYIGQKVANPDGKIIVEYGILIPVITIIIIGILRAYSNKIGKGIDIPVPMKRFTEVDDYDEVSIREDRLQELLLYTANLEDWLVRKGLLK